MIFNILIKKNREIRNPANELAIRLEQLKHVFEWDFCWKIPLNTRCGAIVTAKRINGIEK
jgi:hypothetical protein